MSKYKNLSNRPGNSSFFLQKTNDGHEITMQHSFMKSIYAKNYDRGAYGAYLWSQYRVFSAIEDAAATLKDDPCLAPVYDEQLHRTAALKVDLKYWLGGTELPRESKYDNMRIVTDAYVQGLREESRDAKALLCHHFLHYNAVLSGGQFLSGQISAGEHIHIDSDPTGVSFYVFPALTNPAVRVQQYLRAMDSIVLSDEDRDRMLLVMKRIYGEIEMIFDAAHEIAPRHGQAYEATNMEANQGQPAANQLRLTPQVLRKYNGVNGGRILISLRGQLIDVTSGSESYGPGGAYHMFAGHEVTKCLALMDLNEKNLDDLDFVPETEDAKKNLEQWFNRLTAKYIVVGDLVKPLQMVLQSLRQYDGTHGRRILLSLRGQIIDVTSGAESYGPGGPYSLFAGRDVTKCLALMDLDEANLDDLEFVPETDDARKSLDTWFDRLAAKYEVVGELIPSVKLTLDELGAFDGKDGGKIYLSLSGKVIDVTEGSGSYGPGGPYSLFGGRDVTKNLALMDLSEECLNQPHYVPDSDDAKNSLATWWNRLTSKYPLVGEVVMSQRSKL